MTFLIPCTKGKPMIKPHLNTLELIKTLADPLDMVVVVTDTQLKYPGPHILYANPAYKHMTGYAPEEVIGKSPRILQGARTNKLALKKLNRQLENGEHAAANVINYRKSGEPYICDIAAWPIVDANNRTQYFLALERELIRKPGRPPKKKVHPPWWMHFLAFENIV